MLIKQQKTTERLCGPSRSQGSFLSAVLAFSLHAMVIVGYGMTAMLMNDGDSYR